MRKFAAFPTVLALTLAGCGGSETADPSPAEETSAVPTPTSETTVAAGLGEYEVVTDLTYADGSLVDVYRPAPQGPWPVAVFVHGRGGSKFDGSSYGEALAEQGAVAYVVSVSNDLPFREALQQVACAVRYARATAGDHAGDPDNVVLVGFSSGASIGAVTSLSGDDHTGGCVETGMSALPDGFVGYEGPYDWAHVDYPIEFDKLEQTDPDLWVAIDPYAHIGANPELVVRLLHGLAEGTAWWDIEPEVSEEFQMALVESGYDAEVILVEGASHSTGYPGVPPFDEIVSQTLVVAEST